MPRGSSGIYAQPASDVNPPVFNTAIDPAAFAAAMTDIGAELTNSLDRLGRGGMMANLQMGGYGISGLRAAVSSTDAATRGDIAGYLPPGAVMIWPVPTPPAGWLVMDGSAVSRTGATAALFGVLGTTYGTGDGSTTFNLPDGRGYFMRGWDNGRGIDPARVFGSTQADAIASHTHLQNAHSHGITDPGHLHTYQAPGGPAASGSAVAAGSVLAGTGSSVTGITGTNPATAVNQPTGGAETTVKNFAMQWIIRT